MPKQKGSRKQGKKSYYKPLIAVALVLIFTLSLFAYVPSLFSNKTTPTTNSTKPVTNPKNQTSTSKITPIILNKHVPAGYTMGFPIEAGMVNGMNAILLNADEMVSDRFTSQLSGEVGSVVVYGQALHGKPKVTVGIQADKQGSPSGVWLAQGAYAMVELNNTLRFVKVKLGSAVSLEQGKVYHIVIEPSEGYSGTAAVMNFMKGGQGLPYNGTDPDIIWRDNAVDTLFFDGGSWATQSRWPVFIVSFTDGRSEGQPYSLEAPWVVYGSTQVGQTVVPASGFSLGKVAFMVSLKGQPKDKLYYEILDSANNVLSSGTFAEPTQLGTSQRWIEVTLSSPIQLMTGQLYRVAVYSPSTDLNDSYELYGYEFCYNTSIGYGGLQHTLTTSLDGGKTWGEWTDADSVFKLTTH